jgi:Flp pilus assembly protein TadB
MIDNWPEAGAVVGAAGIIAGAALKVFSSNKQKDEEILSSLLKNQTDQTRILDRLTILQEHRDTRTEELHKDTHKKIDEATRMQAAKLDEITGNQREVITIIQRGLGGHNGRLA